MAAKGGAMPGKIKISQINHVTTMVKDTARAMKFYNDLLGIKQIESQVPNPAITWLQLDNGVMVHLIETPDAPAKPSSVHHAFQVDNLEETKKSLQENGYEIKREGVRYDGQAYLFIEDPDGNSVEFCTAAGYAPAPPRP
jgi:catechol 2,3-dioxygenase-like lactoylglutathione lyase family enzyme